jgi:predicted RNA-binding protein YlqC (UPF0109 family)
MELIKLDCKAENIKPELVDAITHVLSNVNLLVDNPDKVRAEISGNDGAYLVLLYTDPANVGQVIGSHGYIINSIRAFMSAVAGKHDVEIEFRYITDLSNKRVQVESPGNFKGAKVNYQDSRVG